MGWKNWPSWLKGGVILASINLIILLIILVLSKIIFGPAQSNGSPAWFAPIIFLFLVIISIPAELLGNYFRSDMGFPNSLGLIVSIIFYFIVGAIIGWLIGKFKK
jgi:hypothetical protein